MAVVVHPGIEVEVDAMIVGLVDQLPIRITGRALGVVTAALLEEEVVVLMVRLAATMDFLVQGLARVLDAVVLFRSEAEEEALSNRLLCVAHGVCPHRV